MLSDQDIELAHPAAFDFVFGNLPAGQRAEFNRHLLGCRHCQGVIDEYREIGAIIKDLPPHVDPPADLEDRTVAAMVAALTARRAEPEPQPATEPEPPAEPEPETPAEPETETPAEPEPEPPDEPETWVRPRPRLRPPAPAELSAPAEPPARPIVTSLSGWQRHRSRLAVVAAVAAAAVAAAVVIPLSLGGGRTTPALATFVIPLHVTAAGQANGYGTATGQATAREEASGSWSISLTVQHLKSAGDSQWYQCWYLSPDGQQVASAGTFKVAGSGSETFSMTAAVDPRDFPTMEITLGPPGQTGALHGTVVLRGQAP